MGTRVCLFLVVQYLHYFKITEFIPGLDTFKMMAPMLGTDIIFISVFITLKILTIGFIAHLCLRAYWLSLVCVNYVYPNGINFHLKSREISHLM